MRVKGLLEPPDQWTARKALPEGVHCHADICLRLDIPYSLLDHFVRYRIVTPSISLKPRLFSTADLVRVKAAVQQFEQWDLQLSFDEIRRRLDRSKGLAMRCTLIHDPIYDNALSDIESLGPDSATPYDPIRVATLAAAYATSEERMEFHGVDWREFCTDYGCNGWGRVNRWSEREQRGW